MKRILFTISLLFSVVAFGQLSSPVINASQIYIDSATISWTKPSTADSFVLQRSTDSSSWSQVYAGKQQIFYQTGLTGNKNYYYRVKAINSSTSEESAFTGKRIKTFWSPSEASQGENRIATQADVDNAILNPDGFIEVGDYLLVGYTSLGGHCVNGVCGPWGTTLTFDAIIPTLAPGKKICLIGGRGYDKLSIDMRNNVGASSIPYIITNIGGQFQTMEIELKNCKNVRLTGKYDSVKKTGSPNYLGFDKSDWTDFYGSSGIYIHGKWGLVSTPLITMGGDCENVEIDYVQASEGSVITLMDKNDALHINNVAIRNSSSNTQTLKTTSTSERTRIALNTVGSVTIDYLTLVGTGSTAGTYTIQAETYYDNGNHVTNNSTSVTLTTTSTSDPAYVDIKLNALPQGAWNYTVAFTANVTATISHTIAATPMDGIYIHDCYFADAAGEGIYSGTTQAPPGQAIKNIRIENCIYARNGGNSIQIGQLMGDNNSFKNIVAIGGGYEWSDIFQKFQDQGFQLSPRRNKFEFKNNLWLGSNGMFFNYLVIPMGYDTVFQTDTAKFINNAFLNSRPYNLGYINFNALAKGVMQFDGNYFARIGNGTYSMLDDETTPPAYVKVSNNGGGQGKVITTNNLFDHSIPGVKTFTHKATDAKVRFDSRNNKQSTYIPRPIFNNYNDKDSAYDYASEEKWTDVWQKHWNAANRSGTKFDSVAAAQGVSLDAAVYPRTYRLGDIVRHNGKFYKSLVANNSGHSPAGYTDDYWELIVFSNGSVMPIDDVRQKKGSFYQVKGIGLNYVVPNTPAGNHSKVKKGQGLRVKQAY